MFKKIDDFMIDKVCQRIADYFADRTTPQLIAQQFLIIASLAIIGVLYYKFTNDELSILDIIFAPMLIIFLMGVAYGASKSNTIGLMPKERIKFYHLRCLIIILVFLNLVYFFTDYEMIDFLRQIEGLAEAFGLWFLSCRRMPPAWQADSAKIRDAVKNNA